MGRRDRHGRGLRAPLLPVNAPGYRSPSDAFDGYVLDVAEDLERRWGQRWGRVEFGTESVPPSHSTPWENGVPLGRLFPSDAGQPARIVVYRRPLEQRADSADLPFLVRDVLVENVAHLLGRRPDEIDSRYGTGT
ncbi:metallopeptidase family protein [Demequina oxidasica]|uniref:metallopeptidase family protein n=1 Tax=Demequina oxidasica TaxID=676199 RepID=UPI0009FF3738|nr:metallopeptidase family protein [Demequina oxidasica]